MHLHFINSLHPIEKNEFCIKAVILTASLKKRSNFRNSAANGERCMTPNMAT